MSRNLTRVITIVATQAAMMACSSSSNPKNSGPTSDASIADAGGSAEDSAVGTMEPDAAAEGGQPIMCGSMTCNPPAGASGLPISISACCLPDNSCGGSFAALGGSCLYVVAGTPDPSCPSTSIAGMTLNGCCSPAGVCGVDLSLAGLGCNSASALGALAGGGDSGPPQPCGGDAGGSSPPDAMTDAAGE
jgi:hypothetical protein